MVIPNWTSGKSGIPQLISTHLNLSTESPPSHIVFVMDEDFVAYLGRRGISVQEYQGAPLAEKNQTLSAYEQQRGKHFTIVLFFYACPYCFLFPVISRFFSQEIYETFVHLFIYFYFYIFLHF